MQAIASIRTELLSVQEIMAGVLTSFWVRRNTLTFPVVQSLLKDLFDSGQVATPKSIVLALQGMVDLGPVGVANYQTAGQLHQRSLTLKRYVSPATEGRNLLPPAALARLVRIQHQVNLFNQAVENSDHYLALTFQPGITGDNHDRASSNLEGAYDSAARCAELVVELIKGVLTVPPFLLATRATESTGRATELLKGARSAASRWLSSQWPNALLGLTALIVAIHANCLSTQMREVARLSALPDVRCFSSTDPQRDSLVVENRGAPLRDLRLESIVMFYALPIDGASKAKRVELLIKDYYSDRVGPHYADMQRFAFGNPISDGNYARLSTARYALAETLRARGVSFEGIEIRRAVRVRYKDVLGSGSELFFTDGQGGFDAGGLSRVGRDEWASASRARDSLGKANRVIELKADRYEVIVDKIVGACVGTRR